MYKISKEEFKKYILEQVDSSRLGYIENLINEAMITLQYEEINTKNIDEIAEFILKNSKLISEDLKESSNKKSRIFSTVLALFVGASGSYFYFDDRYTIEQEYSFISVCVGASDSSLRKENCIEMLKTCQSEKKSFKKCIM
ncbi:hypothetical protein CINS5915_05880 [Campylobacter insulaenigrae]|uniref:hypothetical protein n=1 Tax=Campylobacter insulaenigrae TaxID=260714 RepID=UPI00215382E7|nr:hypothetical protein [Campylobacter insulaenigrae]MCR6574237.1 hypothetical protein [Campylobacter insulaenigrae]MCR6575886.1 hypothetical protein [Campylobacter insulaenigrae]MCR6577365.1 hypothetical protein [Campylobacter insulaenigrae]MCR6580490.1 hypothetical protein [Campylobacter insulaenigrae]MCR6585190.1 hypothetical protein [Campylobacter insulaenigrae]